MSNIQKQSWLMNRRHALRAMGTCIALPMLECMTPLKAAEKVSTPKRSAFIYLANGVHSLNYQITKPGKEYEFSTSLKPLEKHRNAITPFSGLHHPGSLGHHHNCINVFLTGGKIGSAHRNTISVDQKMAEITGLHTRYSSMEIALTQGSLAWTPDGVQLPAMRKCSQIFASLFEEPKGGIAAQRKALRRKASVLDDNLDEVRRLEQKMGTADKGRMEQYLTLCAKRKSALVGPMTGSIPLCQKFPIPTANEPTATFPRPKREITSVPCTTSWSLPSRQT